MGLSDIEKYWKHVVFALIVLAIAFIISLIVKFAIGRFIRIASLKLKADPTKYKFFKNAIDFLVYLIASIVIFKSIPSLNAFGNGLLASAGVLAAIVGLASQSAFSNIVSGIFLVIFRPFSVGDRVKVGQLYTGDVEDITLRHTVIRDFENKRIVIPNNVISNETIVNATLVNENLCMFIEFGISFSSNIEKAIKLMQEESLSHPLLVDNRTAEEKRKGEPVVVVRLINFTDSAMVLRAYAWATDPNNGFNMKCDLLKSIKERFDREGIEIAYPHRVLLVNDKSTVKA
jgi:small conductance mechanosensitive channel